MLNNNFSTIYFTLKRCYGQKTFTFRSVAIRICQIIYKGPVHKLSLKRTVYSFNLETSVPTLQKTQCVNTTKDNSRKLLKIICNPQIAESILLKIR